MRGLVLAHEKSGGAGMVGDRFIERGVELDTHIVVSDQKHPDRPEPYPNIDGYDLLIPGGAVWSVYDNSKIGSWIGEELDLIRSAHNDGMPIFGICFGAQVLAAALGGAVEASPRSEIGWYEIGVVDGVPISSGPWFQWHHDRFSPPPGADVCAKTDVAPQLFRMAQSVGTQFHPEVDLAHLDGWLQWVQDEELERYGTSRDELRSDTIHHQDAARTRCGQLVDWFLDKVGWSTAR